MIDKFNILTDEIWCIVSGVVLSLDSVGIDVFIVISGPGVIFIVHYVQRSINKQIVIAEAKTYFAPYPQQDGVPAMRRCLVSLESASQRLLYDPIPDYA